MSDVFPGISVERIVAKHHHELMRFLRRRLRGTDAEDLAQDVYFALLRMEKKELVRDPLAYVFTIAANLVRAHREKAIARAEALRKLALDAAVFASQASEEQAADIRRRSELLRQALNELPPRCRAVVLLRRRDGMTYDEISQTLNVSPNMVKKYVSTGTRHCRQRLVERD